MNQKQILKYDPFSGQPLVDQWMYAAAMRDLYPRAPWIYDPWTGVQRASGDISSDRQGLAIMPPGESAGGATTDAELVREITANVLGDSAGDAIDTILEERGKRYGKFSDHAQITQQLKSRIAMHVKQQGILLEFDHQEALDMICHKIGRIVNGDPNYADSWDDIAGYAKLVGDRLRGVSR